MTAVLVVLVLSVLAVGVAWIAVLRAEVRLRRAGPHASILAADAGTEAGIHFLRVADVPPAVTGAGGAIMSTGTITLQGSQSFEFACLYEGRSFRPGWGVEYPDFDYSIRATGYASARGEGHASVLASRMFKMGY